MVFNRQGRSIEIIKNHGTHDNVPEMHAPLGLVTVLYADGQEEYQFIEFLRASKGFKELSDAFSNAPVHNLGTESLSKAFQKAS